MSLPMVKQLIPRGHSVSAYDILPEKTEAARAAGAKAAASPADASAGAEVVLLNLPTTDAVEQAVFCEPRVASAVQPPPRLVHFSPLEVGKGRAIAEKLKSKN